MRTLRKWPGGELLPAMREHFKGFRRSFRAQWRIYETRCLSKLRISCSISLEASPSNAGPNFIQGGAPVCVLSISKECPHCTIVLSLSAGLVQLIIDQPSGLVHFVKRKGNPNVEPIHRLHLFRSLWSPHSPSCSCCVR